MIEKSFIIKNELGIHARPAALLVQTASGYSSSIYLSKDGTEVNAKSIMGVLMLEACCGSEIVVRAEGNDESEAICALEKLIIERTFDE